MDSYQEILFDINDGIGTITLNRPDKLNALTTEMYEAIGRICTQIRRNDDVKVLVITGNGRVFCSGSDFEKRLLPRMKEGHYVPIEESRADLMEPVMIYLAQALFNLGKSTIAAVNGVAAGAGHDRHAPENSPVIKLFLPVKPVNLRSLFSQAKVVSHLINKVSGVLIARDYLYREGSFQDKGAISDVDQVIEADDYNYPGRKMMN